MGVSADEIANREFTLGLRGYAVDEVRAFLAEVAEAFAPGAGPAKSNKKADAATKVQVDEILEAANRQAEAIAQAAEADAEQVRAQARRLLVAAQSEALSLVAETQARIDHRMTRGGPGDQPMTNVESLTSEIRALTEARDRAVEGLVALRRDLESFVENVAAT